MHPNREMGITQMICTYKSNRINIIMFCADLGSEVYGEKTLDIMQSSRMHPNHPNQRIE